MTATAIALTVVASVLSTVVSAAVLWLVRRVAALNALPGDVEAIESRLERELGGNSNGLRQAVDALTAHLNDVHTDVRELRKRFDNHLDH